MQIAAEGSLGPAREPNGQGEAPQGPHQLHVGIDAAIASVARGTPLRTMTIAREGEM